MARPREKSDAGRIAATRRKGRGPAVDRDERPAPRKAAGSGKKGRGAKPPSAFARALKLCLLVAFMAALGFAVVLVVDVSMKVLGGVKVGELTFAELVDKVQARVFDHDVPEPAKKTAKPKATPAAKASPSSSSSPAREAPRAPIAAPSPETWAKEAETRPDPEVEQARARLDQLLKGI